MIYVIDHQDSFTFNLVHLLGYFDDVFVSNYFEIILAPSFSKDSMNIFKKKKKLILIQTKKIVRFL